MFDLNTFWQTHTPIISILIPALTSFMLLLLGNPGAGSLKQDWRQPWRRSISLTSAILGDFSNPRSADRHQLPDDCQYRTD